jgi:hypothetical protein
MMNLSFKGCLEVVVVWYEKQKQNKQEGFLRCQTPTSAVRLEVERCTVKNGGWRIEIEEWRV